MAVELAEPVLSPVEGLKQSSPTSRIQDYILAPPEASKGDKKEIQCGEPKIFSWGELWVSQTPETAQNADG